MIAVIVATFPQVEKEALLNLPFSMQ